MSCVLSDFQHIRPRHEMDQEKVQEWIVETHARAAHRFENKEMGSFRLELQSKVRRLGLGKDRIKTRGIHISDPIQEDEAKMQIYALSERPEGFGFAERSSFFEKETLQIFESFYPESISLPKHLIHVTCTGYSAPSPAQRLVSLRKAGTTTGVTHAYHMGCYGSIPAIRMGLGFCALPSPSDLRQIDIVHTEICSLHMHPLRHGSEQLLVQSLFADGFIKYSVKTMNTGPHLKVLALHEELIPDSSHCMTWRCEDHGLGMTLSKEVPVLIAKNIQGYLKRMCELANLDSDKLMHTALFAIHPGGPKILHHIKDLLGIRQEQIEHSVQILKDYGNMSSATLPHVWERMLCDQQVPNGQKIISLAFGPGLNIAGGLFEKG
jgi:predicted naringenin-chalcone synthase